MANENQEKTPDNSPHNIFVNGTVYGTYPNRASAETAAHQVRQSHQGADVKIEPVDKSAAG